MKYISNAAVVLLAIGIVSLSACRKDGQGRTSGKAGEKTRSKAPPKTVPSESETPAGTPQEITSLGINVQGYEEYRHEKTGIVFVKLPGKKSMLGSSLADADRDDNEIPAHETTLSPFLIAKYEVTQAEWGRVITSNPSHFKRSTLPVEKVSWIDCQEFCKKSGLELPTEAQWEYACRAGTTSVHHLGDAQKAKALARAGWYLRNSGETTHPVGEKEPNEFGLHDMHGNVSEWCEDVFDAEFYSKPEASLKDPVCTSGSEYRIVRGGGWDSPWRGCRSAYRLWVLPSISVSSVGLRPCLPSSP